VDFQLSNATCVSLDGLDRNVLCLECLRVVFSSWEGFVDSPGKKVTTWGRGKENGRLGPTSLK
jgi:hypothetical protein